MSFREVELSLTRNRLETEILVGGIQEPFHFLPEELIRIAKHTGLQVVIGEIANWEEFEWGRTDLDESDFKAIVFKDNDSIIEKGEWTYISDELLAIKKAIEFNPEDFSQFVAFYEDRFDMDFFQPHDHIVISYDLKLILIIHHDGHLIRISCNTQNQSRG